MPVLQCLQWGAGQWLVVDITALLINIGHALDPGRSWISDVSQQGLYHLVLPDDFQPGLSQSYWQSQSSDS